MTLPSTGYPCNPPELEPLIEQLLEIRQDLMQVQSKKELRAIAPENLPSAINLLHYMALRNRDLRELQLSLSEWGLSSLGRAERKVQATVDTVLHTLHRLAGRDFETTEKPPVCYRDGRQRLENNANVLFGPQSEGRRVRIMVTMPSEAAQHYDLVKNLLVDGMNCARINCAHDSPQVWEKIIQHIRLAEQETGKQCRIQMDLSGPKLRTGSIEPGPQVAKVRPQRNEFGKIEQGCYVWLHSHDCISNPPCEVNLNLQVPADWLRKICMGDYIALKDARKSRRRASVLMVAEQGVLLEFRKTVYFSPGVTLSIERHGRKLPDAKALIIAGIPPLPAGIRLQEGDRLVLTRDNRLGRPARVKLNDEIECASIGILPTEVFNDLRQGDTIWFDDGKIGGIIEVIDKDGAQVLITNTKFGGDVLRAEKGINLPDTPIHLPAISGKDLQDLSFVVKHADIVGLSFANRAEDVRTLSALMRDYADDIPAIVLKIETKQGFDCLPELLLAAMENSTCGVMIARGDLAIECGFGRLAEVQEQILWVCEAAHIPVIWATQVLEGLAKSGLPTRAEVTDAAMGQRAECIMLNKGPHILKATKSLGEILLRMQDHQTKKRALLRKLQLANTFFAE